MNASLHPARTEPPAETLSTATSVRALLNTKVGWGLQLFSVFFMVGYKPLLQTERYHILH